MNIKTKLITPHSHDCRAMAAVKEGIWKTPWFLQTQVEYRDSAGRKHKHGSSRWFVAICNSTNCSAKMLVCADSIENQLPTAERGQG
jgi:hypothetical protein